MSQTISIDTQNMRIAFVTDDGVSISQHFGRAQYYEVVTLSNGATVHHERREKPGHHTFHKPGDEHSGHHASPEPHAAKHQAMTQPIADCQVLVARGMGNGAHDQLIAVGIKPVITNCQTIAEALEQVARGTLDDHPERLH